MAWTNPITWVVGQIVTAAKLNEQLRDNLLALDQHKHSGAAGDGDDNLGPAVNLDFTDAAAPAAPGTGKTRLYTVSGRPHYRAGAAGADTELADLTSAQTLTNKTLTTPTIGDFTNAQHNHLTAAGGGAIGTVVKIAETTLASDAASIDFTSIPGTYRHLLLLVNGQSGGGGNHDPLYMRLNGVTSASYGWQRLRAVDTTVSGASSGASASTFIEVGVLLTASTILASGVAIWLIDYANTSFGKQVIGNSSAIAGAGTSLVLVQQNAGVLYQGTPAAITQITLYASSGGNLKAGTRVTLYGLPT